MRVGLSEPQARTLLELAESAGCIAKVRTFRKDTNHTHSGRAFLIALVNKTEARIKPFTHRKEEIVPLSTLRFWKSGCDFDISKAETMIEQEKNEPTEVKTATRFVIYSAKAEGVWAGVHRKWIKNVQSAIFYRDMTHAESTIKGFQKTYAADAILLTDVDAVSRLSIKAEKPQVVVPQEIVPKRIEVSVPTQIAPIIETNMVDEFLLSFDPSALAKAAEDYKKIVEELKAAEALKQEALRKMESIKQVIADLMNKMGTKPTEVASPKKRTSVKAGAVRNAIVTVLKSCSRLDLKGLVDRANPLTPESPRDSVKQAIYKMKRDGHIEQNANGFALTTLGRSL